MVVHEEGEIMQTERILVLDTSLFIHFDDKHSLRSTIHAFPFVKIKMYLDMF